MSQATATPTAGALPPVPAGMTRREYREYVAAQQQASAAPASNVQDISDFTADVAEVAQRAAQRARAEHQARLAQSQQLAPSASARRPVTNPADHFRPVLSGGAAAQPAAQPAAVAGEALSPRRAARQQAARVDLVPQRPTAPTATNVVAPAAPAAQSQAPVVRPSTNGFAQVDWHQAAGQNADLTQVYGASDSVWYGEPADVDEVVVPLRRNRNRGSRGRKGSLLPTALLNSTMLPKVGMVGALGVAAVVAPLLALNNDPGTQTVALQANKKPQGSQPGSAGGAGDAKTGQPEKLQLHEEAVTPVTPVVEKPGKPTDASELAKLRAEAERASRDFNRSPLPGCEGKSARTDGKNGRLNPKQLCRLPGPGNHMLRADAAIAFAKLNEAYTRRFGDSISLTDSYRTYAQQVSVKRRKPGLAARAGTSNHGWGLAIDIADGVPKRNDRYHWLAKHAPKYGWDNPAWARKGGRGPYEPWHWEYTPPKK